MAKEWIWDPPRLERFDLAEPAKFKEFARRYLDRLDGGHAFAQVLTVVGNYPRPLCFVERDYVDQDYRNEFANFYAGTFRKMSDRCQRLHFVSRDESLYLGFTVLRPIPGRLVCRTMLAPPPVIEPFVSCLAWDMATVFGSEQPVEASPFISQDFQYGVCAHAAIWMVSQYFNLRFGFPRLHISDIVEAGGLQPGNHRVTPSRGLTPQQISGAMDALGMLPLNYRLSDDASRRDAEMIARAYLDSGVPLLLTRRGHVLVLLGYFHDKEGKRIYVAHDDSRGPYQLLEGLTGAERLLVPAPGRIYLEVMAAERAAQFHFNELMAGDETVIENMESIPEDALQLRAYLTEINDYRKNLVGRELSDDALLWLSMSGGSHWIWVVELQDRRAALKGEDCVLGEMVVDATTDERHAHVLFGLMPGAVYRWSEPKRGSEARQPVGQVTAYASGCAIKSLG
jgi:hypothetical protein